MIRDLTDIVHTIMIMYLYYRIYQQKGFISTLSKQLLKVAKKVFKKQ